LSYNSKDEKGNSLKPGSERDWQIETTHLPDGYPVYCVYFPSGFDLPFESNIIDKLRRWGETMGKNLYVAPWKVGDPSYVEIMEKINFKKRPAIVMMNSNNPDKESYRLVLDSPLLLKDIERLTTVLSALIDFLLKGDLKEAAQAAIRVNDVTALKSMLKAFESKLGQIKITFSYLNGTIAVESK
jgi:hypothetical protein